jgi:hypothetical protein
MFGAPFCCKQKKTEKIYKIKVNSHFEILEIHTNYALIIIIIIATIIVIKSHVMSLLPSTFFSNYL